MKHRFTIHLTALAAVALLLFGASQALADGTDSGTVISNTATLSFSVGGTSQTPETSPAVDFTVDTKIRPLVTDAGGSLTLTPNRTGSEQHWMKFTVKNEGNSTQILRLSYVTDDGDLETPLSGVLIVEEGGGDANTYTIAGDGTTNLHNTALSFTKDEIRTFYIVAPDTAANLANGEEAVYHLLATAWDTVGVGGLKVEEDETNTEDSADNVYADANGSSADGAEFNGKHSKSQTFTVAMANLSVTKKQTVLDDNFGGTFYVPGAIVQYEVEIANAAGAAAASLATIGDTLNANLTLVDNLDSQGVGVNVKAYTTGSTRTINTLTNADYFSGTVTGQELSVDMTTVLPVEAGYTAGELKAGEKVFLIFNVTIN